MVNIEIEQPMHIYVYVCIYMYVGGLYFIYVYMYIRKWLLYMFIWSIPQCILEFVLRIQLNDVYNLVVYHLFYVYILYRNDRQTDSFIWMMLMVYKWQYVLMLLV